MTATSRPVAHPVFVDRRGGTARTSHDDYVRDLVEQVLFTSPGERPHRVEFGSGLLQLVFAPASSEVAASAQLLAHASLEQWLGDLIAVEDVSVEAVESTVTVVVTYVVRRTQQRRTDRFSPSGGA